MKKFIALLAVVCLFAATMAQISTTQCTVSLQNVGSLQDGQLRLGFGFGASPVTFNLTNGILTASIGGICYISYANQFQCNTPTQTPDDVGFAIVGSLLSYNGSTTWWQCDAGTGGSNLYNSQYYPQCTQTQLNVTLSNCPAASTSSSPVVPTVSSTQTPVSSTTPANSATSTSVGSNSCPLSLNNIGSLNDGQLRLGFGFGAVPVTFNLTNGYLTSSLGLMCYISSQTQLQCNTPPQTTADNQFTISNGQLAYAGSTTWFSCDAGTGGSNLYTTKYYSQCVPATINVILSCPNAFSGLGTFTDSTPLAQSGADNTNANNDADGVTGTVNKQASSAAGLVAFSMASMIAALLL